MLMIYSTGFAASCMKQNDYSVEFTSEPLFFQQEEFADDSGRIQKRIVAKKLGFDIDDFVASDFALENVIASGAVGSLKMVNLSGSRFNDADLMGEAIDYLDAMAPAVDSVNVEQSID